MVLNFKIKARNSILEEKSVVNRYAPTVEPKDIKKLFVAVGRIPENQNFANLINLDEAVKYINNK